MASKTKCIDIVTNLADSDVEKFLSISDDHRANAVKNPDLKAADDMIELVMSERDAVVGKIEAAGGFAADYGVTVNEPVNEAAPESPLATEDEYHYEAANQAYAHSNRYGGKVSREHYAKDINSTYEKLDNKLNDDQKSYLDSEFIKLKQEYLSEDKKRLSGHSGVVSANIAGRSNFNAKQAKRRGNAGSNADERFSNWFNARVSDIEIGLSKLKNKEQIDTEKAASAKAKRRKAAGAFAGTVGVMNDPGYDKGAFRATAKREWDALRVIGDDFAFETQQKIGKVLAEENTTLEKVLGSRSALWKEVNQLISEHDQQGQGGGQSQPAAKEVKPDIPKTKTPLDSFDSAMKKYFNAELTIGEYKKAFNELIENEEAITKYLSENFTKPQLFKRGGGLLESRYKSERKDRVVSALYSDMVQDFLLPGESGMTSFSYSFGEERHAGIKEQVEKTTQADLDRVFKETKARQEKSTAERAERLAGIKDPKTIEDFISYFQVKRSEGVAIKDAYMELLPKQRIAYDELSADSLRADRAKERENKRATRQNSVETDAEIVETKHTKKGHDLFVVQAADRVEKDVYKDWLATAKSLGGYYSRYRGNGATPGFQFTTRDSAEAFKKYVSANDTEAVNEIAKERRDAFADDKSQTTVERLNEMADKLAERAEEALGEERKTNTSRRAGMAARADENANADIAFAETMRNIAKAINNGNAKYLDSVRQKVQVALLFSELRSARSNEIDTLLGKDGTYEQRLKLEDIPATIEAADHATFPNYTAYRSDLAALARKMTEVAGLKQIGEQLLKVADDVSKAYTKFAKDNLLEVSRYTLSDGSRAVFKTKKAAMLAVEKSGFNGKAVPLQVKRGEHILVLSPAEAQLQGVWQGDDKRITLSRSFGQELVDKLHKVNRRSEKVNVPWQFVNTSEKLSRLARMNVESPSEYRQMLREFAQLRELAKEPDKVKTKELEMVGRKNDGLDFFPTSEPVIEDMLQVADIKEGMTVLEPSAGWGHIAEQIRGQGVEPDVVEISGDRRELLELKGFELAGYDFLEYDKGDYDRILMNPPFSDRRDAQHIQHAYDLLKDGGRLVAIAGEGVFFGKDKKAGEFNEWLESVGGYSEKLPEGSFNDPSLPVNTGVNARMIIIDKSEGGTALYSRGVVSDGLTQQEANTTLEKDKRLAKLIDNGRLVVVADASAIPNTADIYSNDDQIQGGTVDGVAYVVANGNTTSTVASTAWHEITHAAMNDSGFMTGNQRQDLLRRLANMRKSDRRSAFWKRVDERVKAANTPTEQLLDEAAAYAVTEYLLDNKGLSAGLRKWVQEFIAAIKSLVAKFAGVQFGKVSPAELLAMAQAYADIAGGRTTTKEGVQLGYEQSNTVIQQPDSPAYKAGDLLATDDISGKPARHQKTDNFRLRYKQVKTGEIRSGIDSVEQLEDAAHVAAAFRKHAQETALAIVADSQNKIIHVIRHTKGSKSSSIISPAELSAAIASTKDAANVWFAHNHPSGKLTPSGADRHITQALISALDGTGVRVRGHVIVGDGGNFSAVNGDTTGKIKPLVRSKKIAITERVVRKNTSMKQVKPLDSVTSATEFVNNMETETGVILLDTQVRPLGVVALTEKEMSTLREQGTLKRLLDGIDQTNAGGAIVVAKSHSTAENIGNYIARLTSDEFRHLDSFVKSDNDLVSLASTGQTLGNEQIPFFSKHAGAIKRFNTFFSGMGRALSDKMPNSISGKQLAKQLSNEGTRGKWGIKAEEVEWTGIVEWLNDQKGKVTKQDVAEFVEANQVQVKEVEVGSPSESDIEIFMSDEMGEGYSREEAIEYLNNGEDSAMYKEHTIKGEAKNYRELLLTLPNKNPLTANEYHVIARRNGETDTKAIDQMYNDYIQRGDFSHVFAGENKAFKSTHWDEKNVLAHIRYDERTDVDGNKVLFINELQSDWHQEGRKKGYREAGNTSEVNPAVPNAPFKGNAWVNLAMKRMIRHATENGFDKVAWATGDQSADLYSLNKQIDAVDWDTLNNRLHVQEKGGIDFTKIADNVTEGNLAAYIGKEAAEKLINQDSPPSTVRVLRGEDLKIGGDGMRGFYDKTVPNLVNKYIKKWGAKVGTSSINVGDTGIGWDVVLPNSKIVKTTDNKGVADATAKDFKGAVVKQVADDLVDVHAFIITDEMKAAVNRGQPLFSKAPASNNSSNDQSKVKQIINDSALANSAKSTFYKLWSATKEQSFGAITLRQLSEVSSKVLPLIRDKYMPLKQLMEVAQNTWQHKGGAILDDRSKLSEADNIALSDVQHDATMNSVDPSKSEYLPRWTKDSAAKKIAVIKERAKWRGGEGHTIAKFIDEVKQINHELLNEPEREAAFNELQPRYQALPATAKKVYIAQRDYHKEMLEDRMRILEDRLGTENMPLATKTSLMTVLKDKFETAQLASPYFPLARFGKFWVYSSVDEDVSFDMFESEKEQQQFIEQLKADGSSIRGVGKNLENLQNIDGVSASFVAEVDGLIQKAGSGKVVDDLRHGIYQLYLESLPDISSRKSFIQRKKIAGFHKDQHRAFAHAVEHGSSEIARLEYGYQLAESVTGLERQVSMAQSGYELKQAKTEVEQLKTYLTDAVGMKLDEIKRKTQKLDIEKDADELILWKAYQKFKADYKDHQIEKVITQLNDDIAASSKIRKSGSNVFASDALNELRKSHDALMKPNSHWIASGLNSLGFAWFLGLTPAAAVVNLFQTPVVSLPVAAAKYGWSNVSKEMSKATKDFFSSDGKRISVENSDLTVNEKAAFKSWYGEGLLDKTLAHDIAGMAESGIDNGTFKHKLMNVLSFSFHHAERANREITALAVYRAAINKGHSHVDAVKSASDLVWKTHFDYTSTNRGRFMRGNVMRVVTQFKQYSQGITYLYTRTALQAFNENATVEEKAEARKALIGMVGMQSAIAGSFGLPLSGLIIGLAQALEDLAGDDDDPRDVKAEIRVLLDRIGGKTFSHAVSKGLIDAYTPWSVHGRLGHGDLWFRTSDRELEGRDQAYDVLKAILGPMATILIENPLVAKQLASDGHFERASEYMMPKALKDTLKGARFFTEDYRSIRGYLQKDASWSEIAGQVVGFASSDMSEIYEQNTAVSNTMRRRQDRRSALIDAMVQARQEKKSTSEIRLQIREWNKENPKSRITSSTIQKSIKTRGSRSKNMKNGLYVNKRDRDLQDRYEFLGDSDAKK